MFLQASGFGIRGLLRLGRPYGPIRLPLRGNPLLPQQPGLQRKLSGGLLIYLGEAGKRYRVVTYALLHGNTKGPTPLVSGIPGFPSRV